MNIKFLYIFTILGLLLWSCNTPNNKSYVPKIIYKTDLTEKYKDTIIKAKKSAEDKISKRYNKEYKLQSRVIITLKDGKTKPGVNIGGENKYLPGIGSIITINYIDENLFGKLEHEFAHAVRRSNGFPPGHTPDHDDDFYNWKLTRVLTRY